MKDKKVYIWPSSIPEKWKKIAGEDHFVHISKSARAKNTLEFLQETQRYIVGIRGNVQAGTVKRPKWPVCVKREVGEKGKWLGWEERKSFVRGGIWDRGDRGDRGDEGGERDEGKLGKAFELNHSPLLPSLSEKNVGMVLPALQKFRRNGSTNSMPDTGTYLKFVNQHTDYLRASRDRPPDFICLPKALKASSNRVFNSFRS